MIEIFNRFPELIKALLLKISKTSSDNEALNRLTSKLAPIMSEFERLSQQKGEKLTDQQINDILKIPKKDQDAW